MAVAGAAAAGAALPARAAADQAVVDATIFPGTAGSASTTQVMLSTLSTCGSYTGPASITMQTASGSQPAQSISEPAWTLGTVLECGLQIPSADVSAVQVTRFSGAPETPLSNLQIFDTGQYPGFTGALPTIYVDGGENQTTYVRPPLSATDPNAADNVTQQGDPVSLVVYEHQPPLVVTASSSPVAGKPGAAGQFTLSATVTTADGTAVPSSALAFSWTVGDSTPLSGPTPLATVASGITPVTVQAYDQATGTGGTDTFDITYNPQSSSGGPNKHPGAGKHQQGQPTGTTKLKRGTGLEHAGTNNGKSAGRASGGANPSTHAGTASPPAISPTNSPSPASSPPSASSPPTAAPTTTQTTTVTTPASTPSPNPGLTADTTPTQKPPSQRTHATKRRSAAELGASERRVTGRLVADVQALPAGESPLVHPITASAAAPPVVHAASDGTSAPTWAYATLAVLALLAGGALYERRGRRGRTLHR